MTNNSKTNINEGSNAPKRRSAQEAFNVIRESALSLKDKTTTPEEAKIIVTEMSSFLQNICILMFEREMKEELLTTNDVRKAFEFIKIKQNSNEKK